MADYRALILQRHRKLKWKVFDKAGFIKAAQPVQDQLAAELGPHAVKLLQLVRDVK